MAIARSPSAGHPGLTQAMGTRFGLSFDPWSEEDGEVLSLEDQQRLRDLGCAGAQRVGDGTAWLEAQGLLLLASLTDGLTAQPDLHPLLQAWIDEASTDPVLERVVDNLGLA